MNRRMVVSIEQAQEIAKAHDIAGLEDAVAAALAASWDALTILAEENEDGSYDLSVVAPETVTVGLYLEPYAARTLALPTGFPSSALQVGLAAFGEVSAMSVDDQRKLIGIVGEVCQRHSHLQLRLANVTTVEDGEGGSLLAVGAEDTAFLDALRNDLVAVAAEAGFEPQTLGNAVPVMPIEEDAELTVGFEAVDVYFRTVTVSIGESRIAIDLQEPAEYVDDDVEYQEPGWTPMMKSASVDEKRFTFGPWYVPDELDAHGDHTDVAELQPALWEYVRNAQREIKLQHYNDITAGEYVEAACWPYEVTVPMFKADGTVAEHTFPANTPYLGVIWEPWAWDLIKAGKLSGYSIGGNAEMIEVNLGEDAHNVAKAAQEDDNG